MRLLPTNFAAMIQGEVLTLAACVKLTRQNGTVMGFTSHDKDLLFQGVTYEAGTGASPSSIRSTAGTGVDNLDYQGMLTSDRITDVDLRAGLYDNAAIEMFWVDWSENPITERVLLVSGSLGEVTISDGAYTAELRSLAQRLQQNVGKLTQAGCRVRALFDLDCSPPGNTTPTANPASFRFTRTVASVSSPKVIVVGPDSQPENDYQYGRMVFQAGANLGFEREVKSHRALGNQAEITLQETFPFAVSPGDSVMMEVGCNRTRDRCQLRFNNAVNFRGEPDVPGLNLLMRIGRQ